MGQTRAARMLKVGDKAPLWMAQMWSAQENIGLARMDDNLGHNAVLLLFYPADWSEVCSTELPMLEELVTLAGHVKLKTYGISSDSVSSHAAFAREIGLQQIALVSDSRYEISQAYGVMDPVIGTC